MKISLVATLLSLLLPLSTDAVPLGNFNTDVLTYIENGWTLRNITVFHAHPRDKGFSYITFTLRDFNKGLTLNTNCTNIQPPGSQIRINDANNGYQCTDLGAAFRFNGTQIFISRSYLDHGFGPPGEDIVTFFGDGAPVFTNEKIEGGMFKRADKLVIPATSAIG